MTVHTTLTLCGISKEKNPVRTISVLSIASFSWGCYIGPWEGMRNRSMEMKTSGKGMRNRWCGNGGVNNKT